MQRATHTTNSTTAHPRRGLTLAEVMVSTLLVALLAIGALSTVAAVARTRTVICDRLMAHDLAQHLMTEILQANYVDPEDTDPPIGLDTLETATPRQNFDDVDDYDGWNASPPVRMDGSPLTAYDGWQREVFVTWVTRGDLLTSGSDTGLKRVHVRVTAPNGTELDLVSLRTANGVGEQAPIQDATLVTGVEAQLKLGAGTPATLGGTNVVNHANDK